MSLQIKTPPAAEPILLADVKTRLRLTSTADDAFITQLMTVAREFAEKITCRSLAYKTYMLYLDRFPWQHEPIRLPVPPLCTVNSIQYLDPTLTLQTWDPSEYFVAPMQSPGLVTWNPTNVGNIYPDTGRVPGAVQINFSAGYSVSGAPDGTPTIPSFLAEGIRMLTVHAYEHPESVSPDGLKEVPNTMMDFLRAKRFYSF